MKFFWYGLSLFVLTLTGSAQKSWIRINQAGYLPGSVKVAVLGSKEDICPGEFVVKDYLTDVVAFRSRSLKPYGSYACFKSTWRLDFSQLKVPGTYYLQCDTVRSPGFRISEDVYKGTADFLLKYMREQQCGYNPLLQDSCHTHDGFIVDRPGYDFKHFDVTGGWHDASDYLQYVTTSANATYQMLFAWEQNPEAFSDYYDASGNAGSNGIPDILDEAKWGLDWLDKMNPGYGIMYNQIADDRDHRKFTLPTLDTVSYGKGLERPVYFVTGKPQGLGKYKNRSTGVSSTAAKYASAFSLGAELLKPFYPEFCNKISEKAMDAYRFAGTDTGVCQTASNVSPYFYEEENWTDDMELAAVQLFKFTGEPDFYKEAVKWGEREPVTPWMLDDTARHYQWYPFVNLGHYRVAENADPLIREKFIDFMKRGNEALYARGKENAFLMGVPFIWCSNNLVVAALTQLRLYSGLSQDHTYDTLEASLRDWLFGCNPWGTSMIVGYPGWGDSPTDPHSAFTAAFHLNIDGGLVDGPVYASIFNRLIGIKIVNGDEYAPFQSGLCVYHDDYGDYSTNEPTMDGTASLTFYLSSLENAGAGSEADHYVRNRGAIIRGDTTQKKIYLVFTGDEYNDGGTLIEKVLKKHKIKAHFFFTGNFYRDPVNKDLIFSLKKDGHYLGPHSDKHLLYAPWNNRDSLLITRDVFIRDLKNNYKEMLKFGIKRQEADLFLPPFEWYNQTISDWTEELGLTLINYTPGTGSNADYTTPDMGSKYVSSNTIYKNILQFEQSSISGLNGFILLLHTGVSPARKDKFCFKLDELLTALQKKGYQFCLWGI